MRKKSEQIMLNFAWFIKKELFLWFSFTKKNSNVITAASHRILYIIMNFIKWHWKKNSADHIDSSQWEMRFLIILFTVIHAAFSMSCAPIQIQYKEKFISKSNDYIKIETKSIIHWFYKKFIQMNIRFPWSKTLNKDKIFFKKFDNIFYH